MHANSLENKERSAEDAIADLINAYKNEIAGLKERIESAYHEGWFDRNNDPDSSFEDSWRASVAKKESTQ